MKKFFSFSFLLLLGATFLLSAREHTVPKGMKKIECEIVPIAPLSKSPHSTSRLLQKGPHSNDSKITNSLNWSGFVAMNNRRHPQNGSVTDISGRWTVPRLSPSHNHTFCATWIGIDGYTSQTVEQIGTEQEWVNGHQENYAWFEMYPKPAYEILNFPVNVNDIMDAIVTYLGNDIFEMTLSNITQRVYVTIPLNYTTAPNTLRNSSEWIVEAPSSDGNNILPLAHFSPISFSECITSIIKTTRPLGSHYWDHDRVNMTTKGGKVKSHPSELFFDGKNFTVKWHHE
jgi:hypothetical protein